MASFELCPVRDYSKPPFPAHDWESCVSDLEQCGVASDSAARRADEFFEHARLVFDGLGLRVVDASGMSRAVPEGTVGVRVVREAIPIGRGAGRDQSWLVLVDRQGVALLRVADYGWNYDEVARWSAAGRLSFDSEVMTLRGDSESKRLLPGFSDAPLIGVGGGMRVKRWWGWANA